MTIRPLSEILTELGEVQDRLLQTGPDDFATRAELSNRQDALRLEAKQARDERPIDDQAADQLEREIDRLQAELERYLNARPSASAGSGGGGPGGGGIDPGFLHEMHRKMDTSFGFGEKQERVRALRVRLDELTGPEPAVAGPSGHAGGPPQTRRRYLTWLVAGAALVAGVAVIPIALNDSPGSSPTSTAPPGSGGPLIPAGTSIIVTNSQDVTMFDAQGRALEELGGAAELTLNQAAAVAFADRAGGLVYLEKTGWQIRHWPDPDSPAQTVVGAGELGVRLFDVAQVAGRSKVLAGVQVPDGELDWTLLALVDMETFNASAIGSYGRSARVDAQREITAASYAEQQILVSVWHDDDWWFELYNLEGSNDLRGLPYHFGRPGSRVAHGVLSPDAKTMAYVDGGTVVVRDLVARTELGSWPLDSGFDGVERIDYDGTLIAVSFDDLSEPTLINTKTGTITPLTAVGVATFIDR